MKNIAIISTSLNSGGAERIAGLLSKELSKIYNVYLFLLDTENIVYEYGGTVVNIGYGGPFYEYAIKVYKEKYNIDVAISFLEIMNFANIRTRGKERVLISERSVQSLFMPYHYSESEKIRRYYDYADEIVACSYGVKYDLEEHYGIKNRISVIYNFINKVKIKNQSIQKMNDEVTDFLDGKEYFVNVGRLHEQKNQLRLIKQFSIYAQNNTNIKLLILGSGELKKILENKIEELNLTDRIKIFPFSENPFSYMKNAKALILSSHYEGLPNVILEAMTVNIPVIATDCLAGPRELLCGEENYSKKYKGIVLGLRGIIVPDSNDETIGKTQYMSEAMRLINEDENYCESVIRNQAKYMNRYSNRKFLEEWINAIEKADRKKCDVLNIENEKLVKAKRIYIYGAGNVAKALYVRLREKYEICSFVVTKKSYKEELIGIPINDLDEVDSPAGETAWVIGVSDNFQDEVVESLGKKGYKEYVYPFVEPCTYDYYMTNSDAAYRREEQIAWIESVSGEIVKSQDNIVEQLLGMNPKENFQINVYDLLIRNICEGEIQ